MKLFFILFFMLLFPSLLFAEVDTVYDTIYTSTDDAQFFTSLVTDSNYLRAGQASSGYFFNALLRFDNLPMKQGEYLVSVDLYLFDLASDTTIGEPSLIIKLEDTGNSTTFSDSADYVSRHWTTDSVNWTVTRPEGLYGWEFDPRYNNYTAVTSLAPLFQTIVDRADFDSSQAITVRIFDRPLYEDAYTTFYSFDGDSAKAPYLVIVRVIPSTDSCKTYICMCDTTSIRDTYIPDGETVSDTMRVIFYVACTPDSVPKVSDSIIAAAVDSLNGSRLLGRAKIYIKYDILHIYSSYFTNHVINSIDAEAFKGLYSVHLDSAAAHYSVDINVGVYTFGTYPWDAASNPYDGTYGAWNGATPQRISHELLHTFGLMHTNIGTFSEVLGPPIDDDFLCGPCWEYPVEYGQSDSVRNEIGDKCSDTDPSPKVTPGFVCGSDAYDSTKSDSLIMRSVPHSTLGLAITAQQAGRVRCHTRYWFPGWYIFMGETQ